MLRLHQGPISARLWWLRGTAWLSVAGPAPCGAQRTAALAPHSAGLGSSRWSIRLPSSGSAHRGGQLTQLSSVAGDRSNRTSPEAAETHAEYAVAEQLPVVNNKEEAPLPVPNKQLDPGLYLVGTPIGNLEDITLRAVRVLRGADRVLAEDTRRTRQLLTHLGIRGAALSSFHEHNERGKQEQVLRELRMGRSLALVSDAGMPAVSDPGGALVAAAAAEGHRVVPIPGPSAVLAALVASGLPTTEFTFIGFLPAKPAARMQTLRRHAEIQATLIAFVPPHSLVAVLEAAGEALGHTRRCVVARELTKLHEDLYRATLGDAAERYAAAKVKGEITLVIEGAADPGQRVNSEQELAAALGAALAEGHSASSAVRLVRDQTGAAKRDLYNLAVQLAGSDAAAQTQSNDELKR